MNCFPVKFRALRFPLTFLAVCLLWVGEVAAQTPAPPTNRTVTTAPAPTPAQEMVTLQFPNSDVADVLRLYETLTAKRVVPDNFVQGKVNIFLSKPVPKDEAIQIIETSLLMNGYSLVPAPPDIMKVIGQNRNPRSAGIPIVSDLAEVPSGDHVISFLFKLQNADPQEVQQVLQAYDPPGQGNVYAQFTALPKSSSILVTENSTVIRQLANIIDQLDVPPAQVVSEFIPLQRADATKVVEMLRDVFEKGDSSSAPRTIPGVPPGVRNVRAPNVPAQPATVEFEGGSVSGLTEDAVIVGKIKISADVRTNRIHVITRPQNLPFVRKLIAEFDANVEFARPVTRSLRYISAGDVLPILAQSLAEPGAGDQGTNAGGTNPNTSAAEQQQQRRVNSTVTSPYTGGQSSTASGSNLNVSEELSTQPVDTAPQEVSVGNAKLIADKRANTIIILGSGEIVAKVNKILDEMDVKAPQVAISTVIGELSLNNDEEFGVDWFLKYRNKAVGYSRNVGLDRLPIPLPSASAGSSPGVIDPAGLVNFGNILQTIGSTTAGTNLYIAAGNYLAAAVHALETTGRFKVISRPTVFTSNNKKAIIASGQEIPVPVNTLSNAQVGTNVAAIQSSIEYKKVALQLEVVPLINSEKEVSLDILQKIDSLVQGQTQVIGGNTVPTIATRYIRSNVSAPNGSTIVLGGLIQDSKNLSKGGIPYLSRLPLVGQLFRNDAKSRTRQELIILMRPEVSLTKLDLYRLRMKHEDRTHFGPELEQDDCPDCPVSTRGDKQLPPPDVPSAKDYK